MFYLFILESIGTSELMLIGLVALIVFGPRKLPELAKTIGRTINEFRRTTDDFKRTWEQEIDLEGAKKDISSLTDLQSEDFRQTERTIGRSLSPVMIKEINQPEIKEIDKNTFDEKLVREEKEKLPVVANPIDEKRDWL